MGSYAMVFRSILARCSLYRLDSYKREFRAKGRVIQAEGQDEELTAYNKEKVRNK